MVILKQGNGLFSHNYNTKCDLNKSVASDNYKQI
ncbi:hypothetical protein J2736_006757 [Paenibacillus qinlingensis]|uniref:Uncharacterized protein n=1 Tax=Paenibacillus qinlingensis TaxID=1837343 RepID=A0ABU1P6W4_9BACL|nr:hypothetical protein [Paenibacillus qinlingensis]